MRNEPGRSVPAPPEAGRTFGFLVQDVARLMRRQFEQRARQAGLPITRHQAATLIHISRREGVSQAEIAALLDVEPISLVRMLDKLCEEGLVERQAHPTDRRVRTLWLTGDGRSVLERVLRINQDIRAVAFAGWPSAARDEVIELLASVKDNLAAAEEQGTAGEGRE